jgi:hypothetical protein
MTKSSYMFCLCVRIALDRNEGEKKASSVLFETSDIARLGDKLAPTAFTASSKNIIIYKATRN